MSTNSRPRHEAFEGSEWKTRAHVGRRMCLHFFPSPLLSLPQLAHYRACLDVFALSPSRPAKELGELAMFVAQVKRERR